MSVNSFGNEYYLNKKDNPESLSEVQAEEYIDELFNNYIVENGESIFTDNTSDTLYGDAVSLMNMDGTDITNLLDEDTKQALISVLENIVLQQEESLQATKENNGVIAKGWDWLKNATGIGVGSDKVQNSINDILSQIDELKSDSTNLAKVYKNVTGNDLTGEELTKLYEGGVDFSKSEIINSVSKYQQGQKQSTNIVSSIGSALTVTGLVAGGIVAAPFTGGISLGASFAAIGTLTAAGTAAYMIPQAVDGLTEKDGYSGKEIAEDLANGIMSSAFTATGIGAGKAIGSTLTSQATTQLGRTAAGLAASEATSVIMGDGIAVSNYLTEVAVNDEVDFSWEDLGKTTLTATAASIAAGTAAYGTSSVLRPVLTSGTTAQSQVLGRLLSSGISGGSAGAAATAAAGSTNYLLTCVIDGKEVNFEDWLDCTTENLAGGTFTGFAAGVAFEAVQVAAGTPRPDGTKTVQKGVTEDGLEYKEYIDSDGKVIARDIKASDLSNYMKSHQTASNDGALAVYDNNQAAGNNDVNTTSRTVRFTYEYANKQVNINGTTYDANATLTKGLIYDWAGNAPLQVGQQGSIELVKADSITAEEYNTAVLYGDNQLMPSTGLINNDSAIVSVAGNNEAGIVINDAAVSGNQAVQSGLTGGASSMAAGVNAAAAKEGGVVNNAISAVKSKIITAAKGTKVGQRIVNDYNIAKANYQNHPVSTSQDVKVIQELGEYVAGLKQIITNEEAFNGALDTLKMHADNIFDSSWDLSSDLQSLCEKVSTSVHEKNSYLQEILEKVSNGEDVSDYIKALAEKGITFTDLFDEETIKLFEAVSEQMEILNGYSEAYNAALTNIIEAVQQHSGEITDVVSGIGTTAQKIPDTNAFKQLGTMPQKAKAVLDEVIAEYNTIVEKAAAIDETLYTGDVQESIEAIQDYYDEILQFQSKLEEVSETVKDTSERAGLIETAVSLEHRIGDKIHAEGFSDLSTTQKAQALIEETNIAFSKFIQTMSSDESLPAGVRAFFKEFTSNCTVTRTVEQAQALADELYGEGKYTIQKSYGAGTIGETYLVTDADGNEFVMKMLKNGVSQEKFESDRKMFTKYIEEFVTDESEKQYKLKLINGLFDSWEQELDYAAEAQGAKSMAEGAQRFKVAQTIEIGSKDGRNISLVMEKAEGIGLDTLIDLLQFYNDHPDDYLTLSIEDADGKQQNPWIKNAKTIEQNSWIKDIESYREALPVAYQKAQNEQAMFLSSTGEKTVHADPHGGNVFVSFDKETQQPVITYIDTGNVITRTNAEVLSDICLSLNMMIGNSEGIAESLLSGAILPEGSSKSEMVAKVADLLDERLYKAGINLKDVNYTQSTMMGILKELNIIPDAGNSNLLKANLQRIKTSREIFAVTGTEADKAVDIKDMLKGISQSFKNDKTGTIKALKPIIKWAFENKDQTLITFFQMMFKNSDFE